MKHTKIVATIGPVSCEYEMLEKLADAGVNVFRLNFSHGDHQWHGEVIKRIKRLNKKRGVNVAILLDTKGPEIRTGDLALPVELKKDQEIILTVDHSTYEESGKVGVNYDAFIDDVEVGEKILVDNGVMNFEVLKKTDEDIFCKVLDGGELSSRRHLNLPMKDVSLESITQKDWDDIKFGVDMGVDFIALSFVRRADEVNLLRDFLDSKKSNIDIIPKIESYEATNNLSEIIAASDGVMVARGDLGAEIPFTQVPRMQREIIETAKNYQKPVIVATHMLESMIQNPMPTRAEVTDVSTAVFQRADAIMLSGETAGGNYPLKSVETMVDIALETEKEYLDSRPIRDISVHSDRAEFSRLAARMVGDLNDISCILVVTRSGYMASLVSCFRPKMPVFAFTNVPSARRKMQLLWGVQAFKIAFSSEPEKTVGRAVEEFLDRPVGKEWKGKRYVLVTDALVDGEFIPTLQVREF